MYGEENFQRVKEIIDGRRLAAEARAEQRNTELTLSYEDIREIDKELRTTGLLIFKTACRGGDMAPIRERNQFLCEERKKALKKHGLPEDYTEVKYTCPKCSDSGYVGTRLCTCFRELLVKENIKSSGMGRLIDKQSFENFDLSYYRGDPDDFERMESIVKFAKAFVESFGAPPTTLLFIGPTGTGKTHISTAIAKELMERGKTVIYDSIQNILTDFEDDKFRSGYGAYEQKSRKYFECDLLIIDDLGTEFSNSFSVSALYNLLNTRQNKGMATILSTNLSAKTISTTYEDRICSRLLGADTKVLQFVGTDKRLYK